MFDHLKIGDMAREAERLLEDAGWLPEPMRMPDIADAFSAADAVEEEEAAPLPAFLDDEATPETGNDDGKPIATAA
jgi:ParB family chromosome partitioning protein